MRINLIEYFIETVRKYPKRAAVIEGNRKVSFKQLKELSVALACEIIKKRIQSTCCRISSQIDRNDCRQYSHHFQRKYLYEF